MKATVRVLSHTWWSVGGFAIGGLALTLLQSVAYFRLAGHSFADREAFGYSLSIQATANPLLFAPPLRPDTVAGYVELRALGPLAVVFAVWALLSATTSTTRHIVAHAAAFAISSTIAAAAACVGIAVGVASGGESVSGFGLVGAGLLLVALAMACYGICVLLARLTPAATVVASALLSTLFFVNSLSRVYTQLDWTRWLAPFRYYDVSTPLPPGGRFDVGGFAVLVAIAAFGTTLAAVVSTRSGAAPLLSAGRGLRRKTFEPSRTPLLAFAITRDLYPERLALAAWCVAFVVLGVLVVSATRASMQDLLSLPRVLPGLPQYIFVFYAQVLGQTWFDFALLMFVGLAFVFVTGWAAKDREGRLEAELSAPYSRSVLVLERMGALALTAAVLATVSGLAVAFTSRAGNLALDSGHLADACLLLVVFSIVLGAFGSLLTSWAPRAALGWFGGLALASYLDDQIGSPLGLPGWVQNLSAFRLVGTPLLNGIDGRNLALMLLLTLAGVGSSILVMQRRDVGA